MLTDRITDLKRKLKARKGNPAFAENIKDIEAEIARLEAQQQEQTNGG